MDNQSVEQERSSNCSHQVFNSGCGCNDASGMVITISPTTGGQFNLEVRKTDSIDHLKKIISKKLKVLRERICLLYRDRQLMNGSLQDNDLSDGCRLTLLPIVETGLTTQRPELSVMNALESLNESQVNDFLSGKAPLNLTMRLGDHMMLIQLMLSTFSNQSQMSLSNSSKTDDHPSTSGFTSFSKNVQKDMSRPENSSKNISTVINDDAAVTSNPFSNNRLEDMLSSRSTTINATETKADLINMNNEAVPAQEMFKSVTCDNSSNNDISQTKNDSSKISVPTFTCTSACSSTACLCRPNLGAAAPSCNIDSVPLAKATRNLTQTLQKLSSEVLTSKRVAPAHSKYKNGNESVMHYNRKPNAILENMEHHGRGIYSGTFSGTLNPALQDRFGRPKKDVSTIIHILNDLLCAEPRAQCKSSCSCTSGSDLTTEKVIPSTSTATPPNSDSFPVPKRTVFNNIEDVTRFRTATVIPVSVGEQNVNLINKANENQTTRSKMEQLKSIMGELKEKRKEKRFSPYEKRFSAVNLISSSTNESWPSSNTDTAIHATSTGEPMDSETIHSTAAVIA